MRFSIRSLLCWASLAAVGLLLAGCRSTTPTPPPTAAMPPGPSATRQHLPTFTITPTLSPSPTLIPTTLPPSTATPQATRTLGTPATPLPSSTSAPSPTLDVRRLYEQAIPLCAAALSAEAPAITTTLESLPLPTFPLLQADYTSGEWQLPTGLEFFEASAAHEVRSLACIQQSRRADAQYSDASLGYTLSWRVRLVRWPQGDLLAEAVFWGGGPPNQKVDSGPGYGNPPIIPLLRWMACDLNHSAEAFCQTGGALAFSPQGNTLLAGIDTWDFSKRQLLQRFSGHRFGVRAQAFSADGLRAASSGVDEHTILLWNTTTGQVLHQFSGHEGEVYSLVFSPDGKYLASGSLDGQVILWDTATGQIERRLEGVGWVYSLAFSPKGDLLAGGLWAQPGTIYLWNVASGELEQTLRGHTVFVTALAFSPDGSLLASGSVDDTVKVWEVASGKSLRTLTGHADDISALAFSPDGRFLASGSNDQFVLLWDAASDELVTAYGGQPGAVEGLAFSPDGTWLASSGGTFVLLHRLPAPQE